MRAYDVAMAVAGIALFSAPASTKEVRAADVVVYVTGDGLVSGAEERALRSTVGWKFARADVHIAWVTGEPKGNGSAAGPVMVHIRFVGYSAKYRKGGALAYTTPFATGVKTITVLCNAIRMTASRQAQEPHILAHVLAHEIGHVLQVSNAHAASGIMKAHWVQEDYDMMGRNSLEFTSTDLDLIREGLNRLKSRAGYSTCGAQDR